MVIDLELNFEKSILVMGNSSFQVTSYITNTPGTIILPPPLPTQQPTGVVGPHKVEREDCKQV